MIHAAKKVGRHEIRDGAIILLMFRHGLRTAELVTLKWTQIQAENSDSINWQEIKYQDSMLSCLLQNALAEKNVKLAVLLLQNGADLNVRDKYGLTPLHTAIKNKRNDVAKLLIDSGADIQAKTNNNRATLYQASTIELAKLLIDGGADINAKDISGYTALFSATSDGNLQLRREINVQNLYLELQRQGKKIGLATVYRAFKTLHKQSSIQTTANSCDVKNSKMLVKS